MILRDRQRSARASNAHAPARRPSAQRSSDAAQPLAPINLLNDLETLIQLLRNELSGGAWLDAFLLAAGVNQIVEDFLHRDPYALNKVSKHLRRLPGPLGRIGGRGAADLGALLWNLRNHRTETAALIRWQENFERFVQRLAQLATCPALHICVPADEPAELYQVLLDTIEAIPGDLLREVLRLPACFRSFDQRPADIQRLVESFASGWPERGRPLLVVGVRTSGSYLAPLMAAHLALQGFAKVDVLTIRPGQRLLPSEHALVTRTAEAGGMALLTDDPPTSGATLAGAAAQLEEFGFSRSAIVLCLQLFGAAKDLPPALQAYKSVVLAEADWTIQDALDPAAVWTALMELLAGEAEVIAVNRRPLPARSWHRSHERALYRVGLRAPGSGERSERVICAKAVGLGYFGQHSLVVAQKLGKFLPRVYGVRDDLLFRDWLPEQTRATTGDSDATASAIAAYTAARAEALAVPEDTSLRLVNRDPVWQRASDLLARGFGRATPVARTALHRTAKRLLEVSAPSVLDGAMNADCWFRSGRSRIVKTNFAERVFSNRDMHCFDAVMDLAGAASASDDPLFAATLLRAYERLIARSVDRERWLLYQLLHLQERMQQQSGETMPLQRAMSRLFQQYYAQTFMPPEQYPEQGPLCAIDIDGVLETGWLGCPSTTPAGALTLRSLAAHGYRSVLVSGRSLDEVRERCVAFGLAGGVAEYGSAIYTRETAEARTLLTEGERVDLRMLREALAAVSGVHTDPDYGLAVRAYRLREGIRRPLPREIVDAALASTSLADRIRPIAGEMQTDFVPAGVNKGTGLLVLARYLGAEPDEPGRRAVALAAGDTISDLPMFQLAEIAAAPANADRRVREAGVRISARRYQAGLAQAAGLLLDHAPGDCRICRFTPSGASQSLLLTALGAQDAGKWGKLAVTLRLAAKAGRS